MKRLKKALALAGAFWLAVSPALTAEAGRGSDTPEVSRVWDFSEDTQGWRYDDSWAGESYHGGGACEQDEERRMLKVSVDYSGDAENGWSQTGISLTEEGGIDYSPYKVLSFDLYYDPAAYTMGQISIKAYSDNVFQEQMCSMTQGVTEDTEDGLKKVNLTLLCDTGFAHTERPGTLMLLLIGNNTDYKGDLWFDNIKLSNIKEEKYLVDSTVLPNTDTRLASEGNTLTVNGDSFTYVDTVKLADPDADPKTVALYQYLKAVGESDSTLFGHMEDTVLKAGSSALTESDVKDVTGSLAAINGLDAGNLFSGYASKYNARHEGEEPLTEDNAGNIEAAARFSNEAMAEGAIITLSSHMPNFAYSTPLTGEFEHTYDAYDYLAADSYNLTGDCMNQILPGGAYHDCFNAYLDVLADYASQVDGPILFRPFHENTGSWFWWGKAFCDPETYKSVFKYTVEYMRDEKNIHNLLYLYGPGSEATTLKEYEERYPGDEYVDLVGFDTYDNNPVRDEEGYTFQDSFRNVTKLTDEFAKKHKKLFAVTETGVASDGAALLETGNKRLAWFTEILDIITDPAYDCCYFMTWSNYSRTGSYYTPYVEEVNEDGSLFGHEMLDEFIRFYNNEKSIFASDQQALTEQFREGEAPAVKAWEELSGYMTYPVSGQRLLEASVLTARLNREQADVEFRLAAGNREIPVPTTVEGKQAQGDLSAELLEQVEPCAQGKIRLYAGDAVLQEFPVIINIAAPPEDPYVVDDFESYVGVADMLLRSWTTNKDGSCELTITPSEEQSYNGNYSLKFDYKETNNGWAGCEFLKTTDWSGCNALQFWVVPDGNNQKTVVQINTSAGGSYEAYLQEYPEYASSQEPMLVTLPFEEFKDKNGGGSLTSEAAANVSAMGLWVNAIPESDAIGSDGYVSGVLYYDSIRAINAVDLEGPVFETGVSAPESEDASEELEVKQGSIWLPVVSGTVCVLSLGCLIWLIVLQKKKEGKSGKR